MTSSSEHSSALTIRGPGKPSNSAPSMPACTALSATVCRKACRSSGPNERAGRRDARHCRPEPGVPAYCAAPLSPEYVPQLLTARQRLERRCAAAGTDETELGYVESGWVPGAWQLLIMREVRAGDRFLRRFEFMNLDTLIDRWASSPDLLRGFARWQDSLWRTTPVALR